MPVRTLRSFRQRGCGPPRACFHQAPAKKLRKGSAPGWVAPEKAPDRVFRADRDSPPNNIWRCIAHMARIAGVDLPREKRVEIGLTYIYGIGLTTSQKLLADVGINPDTRVKDLSETDISKLRDYIEHHLKVEGDLRREVSLNIKRLIEIGSYRGVRHRRGLRLSHRHLRLSDCLYGTDGNISRAARRHLRRKTRGSRRAPQRQGPNRGRASARRR